MALVRCETCTIKPAGRTRVYVRSVTPPGHPDSGLICGSSGCRRPGLIWLERAEATAYAQGERIFDLPTAAAKVRAHERILVVQGRRHEGPPGQADPAIEPT